MQTSPPTDAGSTILFERAECNARRCCPAGSEVDAELGSQMTAPGVGDRQCARVCAATDPVELQQACGERGGERAGQVRAPLGPVEAWSRQRSSAPLDRPDVEPQPTQACLAKRG